MAGAIIVSVIVIGVCLWTYNKPDIHQMRNRMNKYQTLMKKSEECLSKARQIENPDLKIFWVNASQGFREKALDLTLDEVNK
jgi:hypothetical protein